MAEHLVWPDVIVTALAIRQRLQELDRVPLWSYPFPRVAASTTTIEEAETALGAPLDASFREFLRHADGWPSFYQDVDLFGTADLLTGPVHDAAQEGLVVLDAVGALDRLGFSANDLLPIAASLLQTDLFVLVRADPDLPARLLWLAGDLVEEYPSFDDYFLAMLDYQRRQISLFEQS